MSKEFLEDVIVSYQNDIKQLEKVFKVVKKINNASVKVLFESVIIEKIVFLNDIIKTLKIVVEEKTGENK